MKLTLNYQTSSICEYNVDAFLTTMVNSPWSNINQTITHQGWYKQRVKVFQSSWFRLDWWKKIIIKHLFWVPDDVHVIYHVVVITKLTALTTLAVDWHLKVQAINSLLLDWNRVCGVNIISNIYVKHKNLQPSLSCREYNISWMLTEGTGVGGEEYGNNKRWSSSGIRSSRLKEVLHLRTLQCNMRWREDYLWTACQPKNQE